MNWRPQAHKTLSLLNGVLGKTSKGILGSALFGLSLQNREAQEEAGQMGQGGFQKTGRDDKPDKQKPVRITKRKFKRRGGFAS